jgi:hypothetical protein
MQCIICLESNDDKFVKIYNCDHSFHDDCINKWKKVCPLCRSKLKLTNANNYIKIYCFGFAVTPEKYLSTFDQSCISDGHLIEISKPFGVVLKCTECNKIKSYNWLK